MGALSNFASKVEDVQASAAEWGKDLVNPYRDEKGYTYTYKPTTRDRISVLLVGLALRVGNKEFRRLMDKSIGEGFNTHFRTKTHTGPSFPSPIQPRSKA